MIIIGLQFDVEKLFYHYRCLYFHIKLSEVGGGRKKMLQLVSEVNDKLYIRMYLCEYKRNYME